MDNQIKSNLLNATVIITCVSSYIYYCAFRYEAGYCDHFNIPSYFIEPSINTLLTFGTSVLFFLISFFNIFGFTNPFINPRKDNLRPHLKRIYSLNWFNFVIGVFISISFPIEWSVWRWYILYVLIMNFFGWGVFVLFDLFRKKTVVDSLLDLNERGNGMEGWNKVFNILGEEYRELIFLIIIIPIFTYYLGLGTALKQDDFECINGHKNVLVIKKYGELLICNKVDTIHNTLSKSILVIKFNLTDAVQLDRVVAGPFDIK